MREDANRPTEVLWPSITIPDRLLCRHGTATAGICLRRQYERTGNCFDGACVGSVG